MTNQTRSPKKLATRAQSDVGMVEKIGVRAAQRVMAKMRTLAINSLRTHVPFSPRSMIENEMVPVLTKASAVMHVAGERRSLLMVKQGATAAERRALQEKARDPWSRGLQLDVYSDVVKLVKKTLNVNIDLIQQQYGDQVTSILDKFADDIEAKVRKKIGDLIIGGAPTSEAVAELQDALDGWGIGGSVTSGQLETIFRTQLQTAFGTGRWVADQDPDIQEILWGYKYVTAGDDRVRESHAAWDGVTLPKDDPFWDTHWPPNGWNCRCQVIPIFEPRQEVEPEGDYPPDPGFGSNPGAAFMAEPSKKLSLFVLAYNPDQPRVPAGMPGGGQFGTSGGTTTGKAIIHGGFAHAKLDKKVALLKAHVKEKFVHTQLKKVALLNDDPNKLVIPKSFTPDQVNALRTAFGHDKPVEYVIASKALADKMEKLGTTSMLKFYNHEVSVTASEKAIAVKEAKTPSEKASAAALNVKEAAPATFSGGKDYANDPKFARTKIENGATLEDRTEQGTYPGSTKCKAYAEAKGITSAEKYQVDRWGGSALGLRKSEVSGLPDPKVKDFHNALDKLPRYEGITYRGVSHITPGSEMYEALKTPGTTVELASSACSSRKVTTGGSFANNVCLMRIAGRTGACAEDFTGHKGEAEVILRKGAKYKVVGVAHDIKVPREWGGTHKVATFIDLEEIHSDLPAAKKLALSYNPDALTLSKSEDEERSSRFSEEDPETFMKIVWSYDALFADEEKN